MVIFHSYVSLPEGKLISQGVCIKAYDPAIEKMKTRNVD
jgi:hypothetical protein